MHIRKFLSKMLALLMLSASIPLGCGGAQEDYVVVSRPDMQAPQSILEQIEVPQVTMGHMKACVDARPGQWVEHSFALQYDLVANENGRVLKVKLRDATLRDEPLEACFERALAAMGVPKDALRLRSSKPVSGGENTYSSRSSVGIVQAAVAPIAMAPIIIPALGVTIIVAISLDIIRKATSGLDCKRVKQECITYCSDTTLPTPDFGWKFQKCKNECLESQGCPRDS